MGLQPRSLEQTFTTFLNLSRDRTSEYKQWLPDPELQKNMQSHLNLNGSVNSSPEFWCLYWHQIYIDSKNKNARKHLIAYLQEACYWVVSKTHGRLKGSQHSLEDCFQIAIACCDNILAGFQPGQGKSMISYATPIFRNKLHDFLYKQQEISFSTDWSLLRKCRSEKVLREALQRAGWLVAQNRSHEDQQNSRLRIESRVLAWKCFKALFNPNQPRNTRRIPEPDSATWVAIAHHYNQQRLSYPDLPIATTETIAEWLRECISPFKRYLSPPLVSFSTPLNTKEEDFPSLEETYADPGMGSPIDQVLELERVQKCYEDQKSLQDQFIKVMQGLKPQLQQTLQYYYGEELNQTQIADKQGRNQASVSRDLQRVDLQLAQSLLNWAKKSLGHLDELDYNYYRKINQQLEQVIESGKGSLHKSKDEEVRKLIDSLRIWLKNYYQAEP